MTGTRPARGLRRRARDHGQRPTGATPPERGAITRPWRAGPWAAHGRRGAGWDPPRRWGASSLHDRGGSNPAAWDFQRSWSRQQSPALRLPEPQAACLPGCTLRGGRGLRAGYGGRSPTGRTCRPRADTHRSASAAGTAQRSLLRLIATLSSEGAKLPGESHL